jgi:hypothetical protein
LSQNGDLASQQFGLRGGFELSPMFCVAKPDETAAPVASAQRCERGSIKSQFRLKIET